MVLAVVTLFFGACDGSHVKVVERKGATTVTCAVLPVPH